MRYICTAAFLAAYAASSVAFPSTAAVAQSPASRANSRTPDPSPARVDSIFAAWDHVNSPGCALGVSRDGETVYQRGYGMSNLEHAIAITPPSIFHVASISKQFTAFSILLLEQDGKLSVNDDVRKYIPELQSYGKTITIDHLLHHTSGLRDQWSLLGLADWRDDDLITEDDVLRVVTRQKELNFEPGAEYLYSNTGYTLLAVIVKRVSGKSLRDFADERIFKPLAMTSTHFHDDHTMIVPGRTQAYEPRRGGGWRISIPVFDTYGATSLFTTVGDLLKWERNFADAKVGGTALIAKFTTAGTLGDGTPISYARGVVVGKYRGLATVGHSGADAGYRADVVRFPDQRLAVAAFCNLANINPSELTRRVAAVYLGDRMLPDSAGPAPKAIAISAGKLARYAGVYLNPSTDDVWRLQLRGDTLIIQTGGGVPLTPVGTDRFVGPGGAELTFTGQPDAVERLRVVVEGERPRVFERLEPFTPSASGLAPYSGRYFSEEINTAYDLVVRGDTLVAVSRRGTEYPLEPLSADVFRARGMGTLRFERDGQRAVTAIRVSTGRVRRLKFARVGAAGG
ncbi:MAG TPA: serine hydrolase domain-containing protein [Gemmatimonadaceae bacterium]|nr:serine hydrolase domain-containing protein [Gemmatimonadaceae bacterium]